MKGFTLIELIIVIIVIAVLAAVAVPKYFDLETKAKANTLLRLKAQIESASAVNFAQSKSGVTGSTAITATTACDAAINGILQAGAMPSGYTVATTAVGGTGDTGTCVITQTSGSATATAIILKTA